VLWIGGAVLWNKPATYLAAWTNPSTSLSSHTVKQFQDALRRAQAAGDQEAVEHFQQEIAKKRAIVNARRRMTQDAWLGTIVPPFALLGFGLCIAWIICGFIPRK
jgi:hypothetical protein